MRARKLTRWQKASALVPMAVLVGAWGAALTNTSLASAAGDDDASAIPSVPSTPFDQPASVQADPAGIDPRAGADGALATLSTNGIPVAAVSAYRRAETLLAQADESCRLPWHLLAAVGRVESNHGRINGNSLNADGVATPGIFGPLLDGSSDTARINDTDNGALDQNAVFDRAVGPMQFIPGTWASVGVDADNDGTKNPQDIDDSATAAGIYLCAGDGDLSNPEDLRSAVLRYNRSGTYADTVIAISEAYAQGDFTEAPNNLRASAPVVNRAMDQSISESDRQAAAEAERVAANPPPATPGSTGGGTTAPPASGGGTGGTPGTGGGTTAPPAPAPSPGVTGLVNGLVNDLTGAGTSTSGTGTAPGSSTLTWAQAKMQCLATGIMSFDVVGLLNCITSLLS